MSGDVQPRKRKDKKKKKDDLGIEEPRGTAAALGEGDVFMHSHHEHGTGGHWCAKVIFFSLLAVLVTLIGLIILENRGLSELEANSVETRYSGVLEGWLEDSHDDDHHDEHTLELHHHDDEDDDDDHSAGLDHDESHEDDHDEEDEDEDDERNQDDNEERNEDDDDERNEDDDERNEDDDDERDQDDDDDDDEYREENNENDDDQDEEDQEKADLQADDDDNESEEQNLDTAEDEDEVEEPSYRRYYRSTENQINDEDDDDDKKAVDTDNQSVENDDDDQQYDGDNNSQENDDDNQGDDDINDSQENDEDDEQQNQLNTNEENDNENSEENDEDEDEEVHEVHIDHHEDDSDADLEHIEEEVFDNDVSTEAAPRRPVQSEETSKKVGPLAELDEDEVELLELDELDYLPEELPIPLPKGKPLLEVEEDTSTEKPQDTLADEEEYERQQEALRKEKEQASQGMWLKLVVGGALLVATQAVLRRATAPRENEDEVNTAREETPLSDRRMTLIAEPVPPPVSPKPHEVSRPVVQKEAVKQAPVVKPTPPPEEEDDEEEEEIIVAKDIKQVATKKDTIHKELYSDEEEEAEDEEEEEDIVEEKAEPPKPIAPTKEPFKDAPKPLEKKVTPKVEEKEPTPEEDDDVEIIEEEEIGEDFEEEEEISDVDDAELLNRLEAKYGRLPEPERPGRKKDGGNSVEDEWPGEPSDAYWRDELDRAERDLRQGEWTAAAERAGAAELRASARARYVGARALDAAAEAQRDNGLLSKAIAAYLELLKMNEKLSDKKLIEVTDRALDRMKFRGNYLGAEPLYRLLIRRFPDDPIHRNNLTVSFLMANRVDLAEEVIKETLKTWPNDRLALAHQGFILKTLHNKLEEAVDAFTKALQGDNGPANEPRFYYHLGDSLLLLGRFKEAHEVHKRGARLGHFLSPAQRSLYNVERLKSKPWWDVEKTPYARLARALEKSWKEILKEGRAAHALYEREKEGLKERGEWSQLDLFVRGREVPDRCARAPVTCGIVRAERAASGCRRGQVKFSSMGAGTHVRPHVGPTNCRLRMHLGLSNTKDTYIRVDQEIRQWQTGKVLMFDDSFEHEVWHNGTGARLVLIVDVWHPDLTGAERAQLPAI